MILEICANSIDSALNAEKGGADRIELCANLELGGITPSPGTIIQCVKQLSIPICVLIRPRSGDFIPSEEEFKVIIDDVRFCDEIGVEAVVIGILNPDNTIDLDRMKIIIEAARSMDVVFHRAFDQVPNPMEALEQLIELGVKRILTSGQSNTAPEGMSLIKQLVETAQGRIDILAGGGLNASNITAFIKATGVKEIHSSAKAIVRSSAQPGKVQFSINGIPEYNYPVSNLVNIKEMNGLLKSS
jgi:copper homeostasis protein